MSVRDDFRLERLERLEAGEEAVDIRKRLTRLAGAVSEINRQIAEANARLPEGTRRISSIAWRPDPDKRHIVRASKWRVEGLDRLITDIQWVLWSIESNLWGLHQQLHANGSPLSGAAEQKLDISVRELRVKIRDVEAKGREIDAKPTLKQYIDANIGKIVVGYGIITVGIVVGFKLLAEN